MKSLKIKPVECKKRNWLMRNFVHNECFVLEKDFFFSLKIKGKIYLFKIEKGFIYDGASIPKKAQELIKVYTTGNHNPYTLIHDFIYSLKGYLTDIDGNKIKVSREFADKLYKYQLLSLDYPFKTVILIYNTIRKFGGLFWFDNPIRNLFRKKWN